MVDGQHPVYALFVSAVDATCRQKKGRGIDKRVFDMIGQITLLISVRTLTIDKANPDGRQNTGGRRHPESRLH